MNGPAKRRPRIGLRREVVILLPVALFLLVLLSIFTLFAYRSGISLLLEERRGEALLLAQRVAAEAAAGPLATQDLRRLAPTARGVAVVGADGRLVARTGDLPEGGVLAPLGAEAGAAEPRAVGPDPVLGDVVAAFVPLVGEDRSDGGGTGWARVDLGASGLAREHRGLRVLTALVLGVDAALVVLVVLFLGRLVAPWDTLLERARRAGETPPEAGDEVAFLVGTFERALEALARPREGDDIAALQRALAASFESGVLLLDRRGDVVTVNPAGAQILEIEPLEIEPGEAEPGDGRPLAEALAGHPALAHLLADAVAGRRGVRRREIETTAPSGRRLALGLTIHPLRRDQTSRDAEQAEGWAGVPSPPREGGERVRVRGGDPIGYLVLFADLTEVRRRSEQAHLADSLRQLGELAAGVAHELRNSLATLKGYLTLIERAESGKGDRAAVAEYVGEVRRETDHLQRVLEDFLSFARPGTARLEEVDLHQVLARAAADPVLAGSRVRLAPPAGPAAGRPLTLSGDPQLLERAFRNLLHNAAEASREAAGTGREVEPEVEVAAAATGDGLEVTVADRGPGVPDEVKERLFQPFASGRAGGVGLGLALARRIVVLHGGRLELEDRPGGGTVARASLPAGGATRPPGGAPDPAG